MKRQIFILVFLVLATFASVSQSYGQAIAGFAPRTLTLANDAMNPIAGKPYDYSAIISPLGGNAYWYATKNTTFMTAGARPAGIELPVSATSIIAGTNYVTLAAAAATPTLTNIIWSSDVLNGVNATTAPLFVVVEYNGPTCTTNNNVKVMQIVPKNAFTIDLTNMTHVVPVTNPTPTALPYGDAESQCYAGIVSSVWASATGLTNNYGVNVLYFELVAANFSAAFKPTFQLLGVKGTQTAAIDWGTTIGTYGHAVGSGIGLAAMPYTSSEQTVSTTLTNTSGGAAIYIRVTVTNNGYEGLMNDAITLKVDATDNSAPTGNPDVNPDGTVKGAFAELASQTLNLRPTVTAGTGVTFVTQVP